MNNSDTIIIDLKNTEAGGKPRVITRIEDCTPEEIAYYEELVGGLNPKEEVKEEVEVVNNTDFGGMINYLSMARHIPTSYDPGFFIPMGPEKRQIPKDRSYWKAEPRTEPKVNRNAPCPCGSGLKFKKCCNQ